MVLARASAGFGRYYHCQPALHSSSEWTQLDRRVKLYEPELALHGGADGLQLIRALLAQAPQNCAVMALFCLKLVGFSAKQPQS